MPIIYRGQIYVAVTDSYLEAEIFAGDQHLGFIIAKNKKLLQQEAQRLYDWSKEDYAVYSPGEEFGPLRIESTSILRIDSNLEASIDELSGHQWRDENDKSYVEQALAELEERGVWQA